MNLEPGYVARDPAVEEEANILHAACGIYTRPAVVDLILDSIDWRPDLDLKDKRLLEPAAGDGAFVKAAADRLVRSFAAYGRTLTCDDLTGRILAFEIHAGEAAKCRASVLRLLAENGLRGSEAELVAADWIRTADFLLWPLERRAFSHVVGNPPYLRWSKLPACLRGQYERVLPSTVAKGDLFLPFLDRGIEALETGAKLAFLCSDRWKYMGFADEFRKVRLPDVDIVADQTIKPADAYVAAAATYPSLVVMRRRSSPRRAKRKAKEGITLKEAGFEVRVGPALGCTDAFVLPLEQANEVEEELLQPWLSPSDVRDGWIENHSKVVICLHDAEGKLRNLDKYPKARAWLSGYREQLEGRSVVRKQKAVWYRPIDKVSANSWRHPKLLVPELSKIPRLALDVSSAVPAHGLYAIKAASPDADIEALFARLSGGRLSSEMAKIAPRANGGYLRCYKRFLEAIALV